VKSVEVKKNIWNTSFYFRILCMVFFWYVLYLNFEKVMSIEHL